MVEIQPTHAGCLSVASVFVTSVPVGQCLSPPSPCSSAPCPPAPPGTSWSSPGSRNQRAIRGAVGASWGPVFQPPRQHQAWLVVANTILVEKYSITLNSPLEVYSSLFLLQIKAPPWPPNQQPSHQTEISPKTYSPSYLQTTVGKKKIIAE